MLSGGVPLRLLRHALEGVAATTLFLMMALAFIDVAGRFFLNSPKLSRQAQDDIAFWNAAYLYGIDVPASVRTRNLTSENG